MASIKDQIWSKGSKMRDRNPEIWRRDSKGNVIRKNSYGSTGAFGWEIDHEKPKSQGGSADISNLQPLHWEANRKKSDKYNK